MPSKKLKFLDVSWNQIETIDYAWLNKIKQPCEINLTGNPVELDLARIPKNVVIIDEKQ